VIPDEGASAETDVPLGRNRDFRVFAAGQTASALGDSVTLTAMPLLVLSLTGSGVAMGIVGALQTLPDLVLGLPAGAIADRWDRRRLMLWSDLGRAALTALVPIAAVAGWDTMAVILLVTAPINALRVLFMAGFTSSVPNLVGRSQVGRANGMIEAIISMSFVAGPALAGVLVGAIGAGPTLAIDALSFAVSAASLTFVRRPLQQARSSARETHILADIAEGLRFVIRHRTLRTVIAYWSATSVVTASIVNALIFLVTLEQHRSPETLGLILSAFGLGYTGGAVLAGAVPRRRLGLTMLVANLGTASCILIVALLNEPILQAVVAAAAGIANAHVLISYVTLRATIPPDALLGRVGSTARMLSVGLTPIGVFFGGVLLESIGGAETLLLIGGSVVVLTGLFSLSAAQRGAVAGAGRA
jgi:MFS family permease